MFQITGGANGISPAPFEKGVEMQKLRAALLFLLVVPSAALWAGCDNSASDKPEMVIPKVPPGEAQKDSMDAFKREHHLDTPQKKK